MADHLHNNGGRNWSALPSDVLATIAGDLLPIPDRIRFRSVCKSWSNAVPPVSVPSPWLLLPTNAADSLTFAPLASLETTFDSPAPPGVAGTHVVGSHDGWLALADLALNVFLFNPFTADRVDLPAFTTLPSLKFLFTIADDRSAVTRSIIKRRGCYIRKIVFNSSPTAENFMAVAIDMTGGVVYTRAGADSWNSFADRMNYLPYNGVHDVLFHEGRFWAVNENGKLLAFDLRGEGLPEVLLVFDMFGIRSLSRFCKVVGFGVDNRVLYGDMYLTVGNVGSIAVVFRYKGEGGEGIDGRMLVVIEFVGPEFDRVRRVRSLEGHSLFVGYNNGFSLPVEDGLRLRGNCVYVNDIICDIRRDEYDMGVFDMGNESFELLFPRCMEFMWCQPPPVIFMPSMKRNNLESTFSAPTLQGGKISGGKRRKKTSGSGRRVR